MAVRLIPTIELQPRLSQPRLLRGIPAGGAGALLAGMWPAASEQPVRWHADPAIAGDPESEEEEAEDEDLDDEGDEDDLDDDEDDEDDEEFDDDDDGDIEEDEEEAEAE